VLKEVKQGVFMLLNAVYMHPVKRMEMYVVGGLVSQKERTAFH